MKQQPPNQASGASETTRLFCTQISSAAGAAGELKQHRKEPDMAIKGNTNPSTGKGADSGVINNPDASRARTHARVVRQTETGIYINNNIPANHAHACAHARDGRTPFSQDEIVHWRERIFAEGQEDPVEVAVSEAVAAFGSAKDFNIWAWYANRIGVNNFLNLYFEQVSIMRNCTLRSPAAAFHHRLKRFYLATRKECANAAFEGSGRSPVRSSKEGGAA
jgi:hypothetical protein